jgi:hypothetical protein
VFERIGDRAVAIVQGAPKPPGFTFPRQSNEFHCLCGVETPHAYLVLDGRDRKVTLFLPPRDERLERAEGKAGYRSGGSLWSVVVVLNRTETHIPEAAMPLHPASPSPAPG